LFPSTLINDELCDRDEVYSLWCRERLYIQFRWISAFNESLFMSPLRSPTTSTALRGFDNHR
jgi:hypothetical protein